MDINESIKTALNDLHSQGLFQETLTKKLKETIEYTIDRVVGRHTKFADALEKVFIERLGFDPEKVTLPEYQSFVINTCAATVKELMNAERAQRIGEAFREKIAPHMIKEMSFADLIESIFEPLREEILEEKREGTDPDNKFLIVCSREKALTSYSTGRYYTLMVYENDKSDHNRVASLSLTPEGKVYHHRDFQKNGIGRYFASLEFNKTLVADIDECDEELDSDSVEID